MFKKLKTIMLSMLLVGAVAAPVAVPSAASAQIDCGGIEECLDEGAVKTDPDSASTGEEADERVFGLIETVIDIFSLVVGVVSVIMIIIGGLRYITSGGDSGNVSGAKNTILYAIIGLVVVALAQVIVRFVLNTATTT